jgi:hypothetical protein
MKDTNFAYPPIFVSSADSYSDVWELFFTLFKKHWPEFTGTIYLNTQIKDYKHEGLNIICTQLGHLGSFGKEMRACLNKIDSDYVMIMLIDFIFMGKVNDEKIRDYFSFFKSSNLDCLNFKSFSSINQQKSEHSDLKYVYPPAPHLFFNYQIAFWKKNILFEMVLPHENPWTSEWYGTMRAEKMNLRLAIVNSVPGSPIDYDESGCLSKGQWHPVAVKYLKENNFNIDFEKRGFSNFGSRNDNKMELLKNKFKIKKMIVQDGLKGSYLDLLFRKSIH